METLKENSAQTCWWIIYIQHSLGTAASTLLYIPKSHQNTPSILCLQWALFNQAMAPYLINIGHMNGTFPSISKEHRWLPLQPGRAHPSKIDPLKCFYHPCQAVFCPWWMLTRHMSKGSWGPFGCFTEINFGSYRLTIKTCVGCRCAKASVRSKPSKFCGDG